MRGHEAILDMRRRGVKPNVVFVELGEDRSKFWAVWQHWSPRRAHVEIRDNEPINLLDLRWAVGLNVLPAGVDETRVERLHHALVAAGARLVLSSVLRMRGEEAETVQTFEHLPQPAETR